MTASRTNLMGDNAISREYSTSGPICPYCKHEETPDEPYYFNDSTTSMECGNCERKYAVEVYHETSWTTQALDRLSPDLESE